EQPRGQAVAELSQPILAPASDPATFQQRARVPSRGVDLDDMCEAAGDGDGDCFHLFFFGPAVAELSPGVAAPALDGPGSEEGAGVFGAGAHLHGSGNRQALRFDYVFGLPDI